MEYTLCASVFPILYRTVVSATVHIHACSWDSPELIIKQVVDSKPPSWFDLLPLG